MKGRALTSDPLIDISRFGELKSLTKRLAYGLVYRANLKEEDVILVFSPNTLLYPAFVLAAQAATLCVTVSTNQILVYYCLL